MWWSTCLRTGARCQSLEFPNNNFRLETWSPPHFTSSLCSDTFPWSHISVRTRSHTPGRRWSDTAARRRSGTPGPADTRSLWAAPLSGECRRVELEARSLRRPAGGGQGLERRGLQRRGAPRMSVMFSLGLSEV